ncbi:MAG: formylglycine-generating enzyme family protein, partial [Candidatus Zixiibacteriota bacterium]
MKYVVNFVVVTLVIVFFVFGCASRSAKNPDMVFVEGGTFAMGNLFTGGSEDELPVHEVKLDSYYIGRYEVTVGEFAEFVEAASYVTTAEQEGGAEIFDGTKMVPDSNACWNRVNFKQEDDYPVVCVSWFDAVEFCNWLSKHDGLTPCYRGEGDAIVCDFAADGYRLPTEAEWEFAARCRGQEYRYAWGNGEPYINDEKAANIRDEAAKRGWGEAVRTYWQGYDDGYLFTAPVTAFAANELGIYGMSGNVYEWCWDRFDDKYYSYSPSEN